MKKMWVYILASKPYGTLYTAVTNDLIGRVYQHKAKALPGFISRYNVDQLVHFEQFGDLENAIQREKQIKNWPRVKKLRLIEQDNKDWRDLYPELLG